MTSPERQTLSVVILTKNEEARIRRCLDSVRWADEIVVVDGLSTDRTVEICQAFGARVISHAFEGSFAQERNLGLEHARSDWVLQVDADDVVTPPFRAAVERLLATHPSHAAFKFRRKSYLLGRFMRYGGWHHYLPNLVRREAVRYEGVVHERPVVQGTIGQLDADVEHHPCESLEHFLHRHNRYTTLSAGEWLRARGRMTELQIRRELIRRTWKAFWKSYIKKAGVREGMHGLVFAGFFASVEMLKWAKYWERCRSTATPGPRA
jgi:glycosyltransferase involved in cell wall biosynthesis